MLKIIKSILGQTHEPELKGALREYLSPEAIDKLFAAEALGEFNQLSEISNRAVRLINARFENTDVPLLVALKELSTVVGTEFSVQLLLGFSSDLWFELKEDHVSMPTYTIRSRLDQLFGIAGFSIQNVTTGIITHISNGIVCAPVISASEPD
jgi:hypothetical protein